MLTGEFFNKRLLNTNTKAKADTDKDTDTNKGNINNTNAITYTSPYSKVFEKVFAKTRKIIICRILFMAFLIFTAFTLATSFPHFTSEFHMEQDKKLPVKKHDHDNEDILRVHIMAHDNSPQEQALKEQVRDEFLALTEHYRYFECRDALLENLEKDIGELEAKLNDKIKVMSNNSEKNWETPPGQTGSYDRSAEVKLTEKNFPLRHYGEHIFPPGEYQALVVNIGKAKGQNWWCLLYPPLCFPMAETPCEKSAETNGFSEVSTSPEGADSSFSKENNWFEEEFSERKPDVPTFCQETNHYFIDESDISSSTNDNPSSDNINLHKKDKEFDLVIKSWLWELIKNFIENY